LGQAATAFGEGDPALLEFDGADGVVLVAALPDGGLDATVGALPHPAIAITTRQMTDRMRDRIRSSNGSPGARVTRLTKLLVGGTELCA